LKFLKKYWLIIISLVLSLVLFNVQDFIKPILLFSDNFKNGQIFYRYSFDNDLVFTAFKEKLLSYAIYIYNFFNGFNLILFLTNVLNFMLRMMIYFVNYGINGVIYIYLFIYIFVSKEVPNLKITRGAIAVQKFFHLLFTIKSSIKLFLQYLKSIKKNIYLAILIFILFKGILLSIIIEFGIFLYYYFLSAFSMSTHILLFSIFKSVVIWITINIPLWLQIIIGFVLFYIISLRQAENKLQSNFDALKVIVKYDTPYITIINGEPGKGKTRTLAAFSCATVEIFIEELEEILRSIEIDYPDVNFSKYELKENLHEYLELFPDHHYYKSLLVDSGTFIASAPLAIVDPYADELSVRLDLNWLRPNVDSEFSPLEEYKIVSWSELDKEYNSHYSREEVGKDGFHIHMGVSSHYIKRHGKMFLDYAIDTQVPLNVRGASEMFIFIEDTKSGFPFFLGLFRIPFVWCFNFIDTLLTKYESWIFLLAKDTRRKSRKIRKRYDYTAVYAFLRFLIYYLSRVLTWFNKFSYTKMICTLRDVQQNIKGKMKFNINAQDETWKGSRLYDSTFLSKGYEQKKSKNDIPWSKLERWSSLTPGEEELIKVHSRFINASQGFPDSTTFKNPTSDSKKVEDVVHPSSTNEEILENSDLKFK
jgi:hypothetical protein